MHQADNGNKGHLPSGGVSINSKNASLVLRIDGLMFALAGWNLLVFYRPVVPFTGLPDITPTLYPRTLGAMMIGMGSDC